MNRCPALARAVLSACGARGMMLATAESCTGGMITAALTDIAGSSSVVDRGFVTYSNEAKVEMLGVLRQTLTTHGAVSRETALEMAGGALARSHADVTIAVTGIAGPDGGSEENPVGLVWFGLAKKGHAPIAQSHVFSGRNRAGVREATVETAFDMILSALQET